MNNFKLINLEVARFFEKYKFPKLTQEEIKKSIVHNS